MLSSFLRLQRAKQSGYVFTKIRFGESMTNGRCTFGTTKKDVYDYFQQDDVILVSPAWECHHRNNPTIRAFGLTRSECLSKLKRVLDYVKDLNKERISALESLSLSGQ